MPHILAEPINDPINDPINSNNEFLPERTIGRIQGHVDMAEIGRKAEKVDVPAEIQDMLDRRAEARKAKNWAESDRLRDEIAVAGWVVKDSKDGQSVTKK